MGQSERPFRVRIVEPDARARTSLANIQVVGLQISFAPPDSHPPHEQLAMADAVVIAVDRPSGLDLVAALGARSGAPPVIAIGGEGHDGKSLEHVLLQAEVRGAAATLVKPFSPQELAAAVFSVCRTRPHPDGAGSSACATAISRLAGRIGRPNPLG